MRRRALLATLAMVPVAGCAGGGGEPRTTPTSEAAIDLEIFPATIDDGRFTVSVLRDGTVVDELELTGPTLAREDPRIGSGVFATGLAEVAYTVEAVVETPDGTTTARYDWDAASCPRLVLDVVVEEDGAVTFDSRCEPKTGTPAGRSPGERAAYRLL